MSASSSFSSSFGTPVEGLPKLEAHQTTAETPSKASVKGSTNASHWMSSSDGALTRSARRSSRALSEVPHARTLAPGHRSNNSATTSRPIRPSAPVTMTVSSADTPGIRRTAPGGSFLTTAGCAVNADDACSSTPPTSSSSGVSSIGTNSSSGSGGGGGGGGGARAAAASAAASFFYGERARTMVGSGARQRRTVELVTAPTPIALPHQ